jgi:hypothetical protein
MNKFFRICVPLIIFILLIMAVDSMADTIRLFQGSVLVGKIISEDKTSIVFANYFGTYRIKRIKIDDIYKTNSFTEDIEIHKKLNIPYNDKEIIIQYAAGQDKKEGRKLPKYEETKIPEEKKPAEEPVKPMVPEKAQEPEPEKKALSDDHWTSGRLSFSGSFLYNLGNGSNALPYGYGGYFALDQGLDFASGDRHPGIPGLRFEGGYIYFTKSSYTLSGYVAGGGLMWALPSMKNSWGCFIIALLPGASYIEAKINKSYFGIGVGTTSGFNFTGQAIFGYQKSWGVFSLFLQARYMYIMGSNYYFHTIGGELGFGFNAW